jgi:multicomponent Na+:H+ antiporter subunit F
MTISQIAQWVVLPILAVASVIGLLCLVRGPRLADRVVALDLLATLAIGIVAVVAVAVRDAVFLDVAIVIALLGFLSTVGFTHYMELRR